MPTELIETSIDPIQYKRLVSKALPRPVDTEEECARVLAIIEPMMNKDRTAEEDVLFRLLVGLVQEYEDRTMPVPEAPPDETLRYLLAHSGMKQSELGSLWGTSKSYTSGIVNGKRPISKKQAKLLAEHFKVSVELFL